jgi:hypothetical protein
MGLAALAAVVALLAGPAVYSASAATSSTNGTNPTAGPSTGGGMGGGAGGGRRPSGSAPGGAGTGQSTGQPPSGSTSASASGTGRSGGGGGMGGGTQVSSKMINYFKKNQDGAAWLVAVTTDQTASSVILESGQPVISMGGWSGSDNAMTLAKLKSLVKSGKLRYIVISDGGQGGDTSSAISAWVKANGTAVSDYSGLYRLDTSDVG